MNKIEKWIYWLFIFSIIIDNINGLILNNGINLPVSIGMVFRMILIMICLASLAVKYKSFSNKSRLKIHILFFSFIILICFCMLYQLTNSYNISDFLEDVLYVVKLLFPILIIITLLELKENNIITFKPVKKIFETYSWFIPLTIIIPTIFGLGFNSYKIGGVKGLYYANNEINIILVCTYIYSLYKLAEKLNFKNTILTFLNALALILIGSKTSIFSVIILSCYVGIKKILTSKNKKNILTVIIVFFVISILIGLVLKNYIYEIFSRNAYFYNLFKEEGNILDFLTNTRTRRIIPIFNKNILENSHGLINLFFGVGRSHQFTENYLLSICEMDFFDTMFWYGLVTATIVQYFYFSFLKKNFKSSIGMYKLMGIMIIIFSFIAGHVWYSALAGEMLALVCFSQFIREEDLK